MQIRKKEIFLTQKDKKKSNSTKISSAEQPVCGVCNVQFSKYTCPHCNLHYCSLQCFRSPSHSSCSESFDRTSLLDDIHGAKDKSQEEKTAMLEMLKRFEQESLEAEEGLNASDEDEEEEDEQLLKERAELEKKLEGLDLDSLSPEAVLELLSPSQREAFQATLQDSAKISALVSDEFEGDEPWWEDEETEPHEKVKEEDEEDSDEEEPRLPTLVDPALLPPLKLDENGKAVVNSQLIYNISAVLLAYSYVLRTFALRSFSSLPSLSTERPAASELLSTLIPFLVVKSTTVLQDSGSALDYVVSRAGSEALSPRLMIILIRDLSTLLTPKTISTISSPTASSLSSHPSLNILTSLSDIYDLFDPPPPPPPSRPQPLISRPSSSPKPTSTPNSPTAKSARMKLLFYISLVSSPNSSIPVEGIKIIAETLEKEAERRQEEIEAVEEKIKERAVERASKVGMQDQGEVRKGPKIEVIS